MAIDIERVRGAALPETTASWRADDGILYGVPPAMSANFSMVPLPGMDVELAQLLLGNAEVRTWAS